jgi:hypothetical protein
MYLGSWSLLDSTHVSKQAAMDNVVDYAEDLRALQTLGRKENSFRDGLGTSTPWGRAQMATRYAVGINRYSTAGHGGFKVSKGRLEKFPAHLRNAEGWYEEDCEWAKVALAAPEFFTPRELRFAEETVINWHPAVWEIHHGRKLVEGESFIRDQEIFAERHANDLVVISASMSDDPELVKVIATLGGVRGGVEEKAFLVPSDEYARRGQFGFVIDADRHVLVLDEPVAEPGMRP